MATQTSFPLTRTTTYDHLLNGENGFPIAVRAAYALAPVIQQRLQVIEDRAASRQLAVHHSFNAPLFTGTVTIPAAERDWHLMPLSEDPAWDHRHGFPMPREVIDKLRRIERAGLSFDTLYIAHETPKAMGYMPGPAPHPAWLTPPGSKSARESVASLGALASQLLRVAFAPALIAGAVTATAAAAATAAAGLLVGLDPILFGVCTDPRIGLKPGSPAAWVYIAHWSWE